MNREFRIIPQQRKSTMLCNLPMARNYLVSILCHREIDCMKLDYMKKYSFIIEN